MRDWITPPLRSPSLMPPLPTTHPKKRRPQPHGHLLRVHPTHSHSSPVPLPPRGRSGRDGLPPQTGSPPSKRQELRTQVGTTAHPVLLQSTHAGAIPTHLPPRSLTAGQLRWEPLLALRVFLVVPVAPTLLGAKMGRMGLLCLVCKAMQVQGQNG